MEKLKSDSDTAKKILIFREEKDESARKVILWLEYFKIPFLDIVESDSMDLINKIEISDSNVSILFNHKSQIYNLCDFKIIWFRRAHFMFTIPNLPVSKKSQHISKKIKSHLKEELSW